MIYRKLFNKLLSLILVVSILLMTVGCSASVPPPPTLSDPNPQTITEHIEVENTISENIIHEFITTEIYLEEIVIAEDKISELLLEEDMISEVTLCKTIYVPQENIDEFSDHSQTKQLFCDGINMKSVLSKVAVGTGVILTLTIVKKVGVSNPIASIVIAAADESLKFAKSGAVVGTVFGAFTGAADEIDETGRTSAVIGFALATVGVIVSIVSLVGAVPSAGTSSIGIAEGVHLAWAGIKLLIATAGMAYTAKDTIKAFTTTPSSEIEWDNIDWEKVGVSTAQKAINNAADGYMWGAIYGTIDGSVEGYYNKYCTPYTKYQNRLKNVPAEDSKIGKWTGERGESDFVLNEPIELADGTKITKVSYQNAVPDFSPYAKAEVKISKMTDNRDRKGGNYEQADEALAKQWNKAKHENKTNWTGADVKKYRDNSPVKLTWHEMSNMESMQLVPYDVNSTFKHYGGVAEYKAMVGQEGESDFD